ncbi:hypothetical protein AC1031_011262 [Aphanomyces cochlioides]|nr:hypothetical protein AC1031_011262 [Aphanomyces cochlioides]
MSRIKKDAPREGDGRFSRGEQSQTAECATNTLASSDHIVVMDVHDNELEDPDDCLQYLDDTLCTALRGYVNDWAEHAKPRRRVYDGQSERNIRRKAELTRNALFTCPMRQITHWFVPHTPIKHDELKFGAQSHQTNIENLLARLPQISKDNTLMLTKVLVLVKFYEFRDEGMSRCTAGQQAAMTLPKALQFKGRTVEAWAKYYEAHNDVPVSMHGKNQMTSSLLHDEDF